MTSIKIKYRKFLGTLPVIFLSGLVIAPTLGLPGPVAGIPIWYQETFMIACFMLGLAGIVSVVGLWGGWVHAFRWNRIDFGILVLLIYTLFRTGIMDFTPQSAWAQIAFLAGGYYIARTYWSVIDFRRFEQLAVIILIVGILESSYGLGQLYGWWPSHHETFTITGTFSNPGPYSGWLACLIPVSIFGILQGTTRLSSRILYPTSWIFLALASLVLIPATSRAAILAAGIGSIVICWPRVKNWGIWRTTWIKGTIAVGILVGLLALYLIKKDSADGRLLIYKVTTSMIAEAPLVGLGWDGFQARYNNFQSEYFSQGLGSVREKYLADNVLYGFNEVLEFTAEMGILGLILLTVISVLLIRKWRQESKASNLRPEDHLGHAVVVTWSVFALFSYPLSTPALAIILPIAVSGLVTSLTIKKSSANIDIALLSREGIAGKIAISILILACSGYAAYWVGKYQPVVRNWVDANELQIQQRYGEANKIYRELYPDMAHEGWFLQYAGKSLSLNQEYAESASMLERALHFSADPAIYNTLGRNYTLYNVVGNVGNYARAESLLSHAKHISPYKYYPRYLLAQHYYHTDQIKKAVAEAEEVMKIVPKVHSPATNDMRLTMKRLVEQEIFTPEKTKVPRDNE